MISRTTIYDIAQRAGVSVTTVSKALNGYKDIGELTRRKIEKLVKELDYAPNQNARSLGGKAKKTIGLLVSELLPTNENGFIFGVLSGLHKICVDLNCDFVLLATSIKEQREISYTQLCRQKNIDGLVIMGLGPHDPYFSEIKKNHLPCALIDIELKVTHSVTISIDNAAAACAAVTLLVAQGHRHIALINGKKNTTVCRDRLAGYQRGLTNAAIALRQDYICYADFDSNTAYTKTKELLKLHKKITAVFCASDSMAIGAIKAINALGLKIPQDISLIGFDDIAIAPYLAGGLTTIRQNPYDFGIAAGLAVYKLLNKEEIAAKITIPYKLINRHTVGQA